uniref:Neural/ectodermal development factor IMP-L2 n=1 Tax=Lygus hesperus TaxID=30085 RepID=A0A146L9M8_LYGHE
MDLKIVAVCIVLSCGALIVEARTVFSSRYSSPFRHEHQNSLSPLPFNNGDGRPDLKKDWVKAHHELGGTTTVVAGSRLELQCDAVGGPMPQVEWFKRRLAVTRGLEEDNKIRGFGLGKVVTRYIVDCVTPEHEGEYSCQAVSGGKRFATESSLVVVEGAESELLNSGDCPTQVAPRFIMFSPMTLQDIGNNVRVPCRAHGLPRPRIFWTKDGKLVENPRFKFHEEGDMEIESIQWEDMGTYTCVAENPLGKESTSTFIYPMSTKE